MVKVSIEPKSLDDFIKAIQKYAARSKQTMRDATLEQAAMACRDAAAFTPPLAKGGGKGLEPLAKKAGERAIDRDVGKVVTSLTGGTKKTQQARLIKRLGSLSLSDNASLFWKVAAKGSSVLNGNPFLAKVLSDRYNGFGTVWGFKKLRNYFNRIGTKVSSEATTQAYLQSPGEINGKFKPVYKRTGGRLWKNGRNVSGIDWMSKYVAENKGDIDTYVAQRQESVGAIKSGWAAALRSLPKPVINGVPKDFGVDLLKVAWINRHTQTRGTNSLMANEKVVELTVTNTMGNVNNIGVDASVLPLVYANRIKQMRARFEKHMNSTIQRANRR